MLYLSFIRGFYSFALPSTLGGYIYLAYFFGKKCNSYVQSTFTIVLMRLMGVFSYLILLIISLVFSRWAILEKLGEIALTYDSDPVIYGSIGISIVIVIFLIVRKTKAGNIIKKAADKIVISIKAMIDAKPKLFVSWLFKSIAIFVALTANLLIARLIGIELDLMTLSSIILIVDLILLLPISISGIGIRDVSYIGLLGLFDIQIEQAVLLSFAGLAINLVTIIIGGTLLLGKNAQMLRKTKQTS